MTKITRRALCVSAGLSLVSSARARAYPTHPVRIIVPFPAGQATDILARLVAQTLSQQFDVGFPVENHSGASGIIGMNLVANANPDGNMLLVSPSGPLVINPSLYAKLGYDPATSYAPISLLGMLPLVLVVNPSVLAKTVSDLVKLAKAQPGKLNFASSGVGSAQHLAAELFKWRAQVDIQHVPYRGSAPATTDLLAGRVQMMFDTVASALPNIRSDQVRALAITSSERLPVLPDVPTMAEAGVTGAEASGWSAMLAPAHTPPEIINLLSSACQKALANPDVMKHVVDLGMQPKSCTPEQLTAFMQQESTKWHHAVELAGIKPE